MRGRLKRERGRYELALFSAWQVERFAREDKLRPFKTYLKQVRVAKETQQPQTPMERLAVFHSLQGAGVPLKITKLR